MIKRMSNLKIGALISYFSIGLNILSGLLFTPWIIQQIGQSNYGIYTLVISLINIFLIDFGIGSATSRFVAKYRVEDNDEALKHFLMAIYKIYLLIDFIILCVFSIIYINLNHIYVSFTIDEIEKVKVLFCIVGIYSLISFPCTTFNGILIAYEQFIPLKMADIIQRISTILLTIISLFGGLGVYALVIANVVSGLISIIFKYYYVKRSVKICFGKSKEEANIKIVYKDIFDFSIWVMIVGLSQRLIFSITPSILGIVASAATSAIAVFGIVTTIESYIYTITTAINGMFLTRITKIIRDDPYGERLTDLAIKVGRFQFLLNGIIIVGFWLIGKEFMVLWMGEPYIQAYYGILLVIFPGLFYNSLQIAHTAMIAQNLVKYQAYVQIIIGISNVIISFNLSKSYGVMGACMSIFIVYTLRIFLNLFIIKKKININLVEYIKQCYMKMSVPILLTGIIAYFIIFNIKTISWKNFFVKGLIIIFLYFIFVYLTGLSKNEKKKVKDILIEVVTRVK